MNTKIIFVLCYIFLAQKRRILSQENKCEVTQKLGRKGCFVELMDNYISSPDGLERFWQIHPLVAMKVRGVLSENPEVFFYFQAFLWETDPVVAALARKHCGHVPTVEELGFEYVTSFSSRVRKLMEATIPV